MVALATLLTPLPTLRPETGLERGRLPGGGVGAAVWKGILQDKTVNS